MKKQGLSKVFLDAFNTYPRVDFADKTTWENHMKALGMDTPRYRRMATEGALLGRLSDLSIAIHLAIISDDAGSSSSSTDCAGCMPKSWFIKCCRSTIGSEWIVHRSAAKSGRSMPI